MFTTDTIDKMMILCNDFDNLFEKSIVLTTNHKESQVMLLITVGIIYGLIAAFSILTAIIGGVSGLTLLLFIASFAFLAITGIPIGLQERKRSLSKETRLARTIGKILYHFYLLPFFSGPLLAFNIGNGSFLHDDVAYVVCFTISLIGIIILFREKKQSSKATVSFG